MILRKFKSLTWRITTYTKQRFAKFSAARQIQALPTSLDNPFFVIVMPGSLHILKIFMRYVPINLHCVFVLNGITDWEKRWLNKQFPDTWSINLDATLSHGMIMDLLFDNFKKPFGMIDSDCFVFNPLFFNEIQVLPNDVLCNAFFMYKNEDLDLFIPQTYFLFFNSIIITHIKNKYNINSDQIYYNKLNNIVRNKLLTLGIDSTHSPESYKKIFDTFRLIVLLGQTEGYKVNFIREFPPISKPNSELFHVGAVYFNDNTQLLNGFKGSYFWRRSLESSDDPILIDHYHASFGQLTSQELLDKNPKFADYQSTRMFIEFVEKILSGNVVG